MRKMVIHFGPDSEGSGTSSSNNRHDVRDTDPAKKRYTEQPQPEEPKMSWRDWLPKEIAHRVTRFERTLDMIDAAELGRVAWKKVKAMPNKKKVIAGVAVAAGVAGAVYLATRRKKA